MVDTNLIMDNQTAAVPDTEPETPSADIGAPAGGGSVPGGNIPPTQDAGSQGTMAPSAGVAKKKKAPPLPPMKIPPMADINACFHWAIKQYIADLLVTNIRIPYLAELNAGMCEFARSNIIRYAAIAAKHENSERERAKTYRGEQLVVPRAINAYAAAEIILRTGDILGYC